MNLIKRVTIISMLSCLSIIGMAQTVGWTVFTLPYNQITSIAIGNNQEVWIAGHSDGIGKFDLLSWTFYTPQNSDLPVSFIKSIAIDNNQTKWIGTSGAGLVEIDDNNWTIYNAGNIPINTNYSNCVYVDAHQNIWVGTTSGLVKFDGSEWISYNTSNSGIISNNIETISIDTNDNVWIGTWGAGLIKFDGTNWTVYDTENSELTSNYINTIAIDNNDNKWIGTNSYGLAKFDNVNWTIYNSNNSELSSDYINTIVIDTDQSIWIGTSEGLVKFFNNEWTNFNTVNSGLPHNMVKSLAIDNNGDIWIGTNNGLAVLNEEEWLASLQMLTGYVYTDINENGNFDENEYPMTNVLLQVDPGPYYGITNHEGQYKIIVDNSEDKVITCLLDSELWNISYPEDSSYSVPASNEDTISGLDFAYVADTYCPIMEVDIILSPVVICSYTSATIYYRNNGSFESDSTTITVELDDYFEYVDGGNLISQESNTLTFDVDTVFPGQSGSFNITLETTCDIDFMGATACVKAHIYPDESCVDPDPEWDYSSISVAGECIGDSLICFTITNTPDSNDGDMTSISEYRLFEDNIIVETGMFQLNAGENTEMCWTATGTTLRLEADQHPAHPGNSQPQESIERCGSPENSSGQILSVPQDDLDHFIEIECREIVASYDPNDKSVVPQGITEKGV